MKSACAGTNGMRYDMEGSMGTVRKRWLLLRSEPRDAFQRLMKVSICGMGCPAGGTIAVDGASRRSRMQGKGLSYKGIAEAVRHSRASRDDGRRPLRPWQSSAM